MPRTIINLSGNESPAPEDELQLLNAAVRCLLWHAELGPMESEDRQDLRAYRYRLNGEHAEFGNG